MSAAKHTPGPWHWPHDSNHLCPVNPDPEKSSVSEILYAEGGYGFLNSWPSDTLAELDANRRLIAAAPELLDACRMVLFLERIGGMLPSVKEIVQEAVNKARAAIAKAEGQ